MSEDRIDVSSGLDTSGLDAGLTASLRLLDRFAGTVSTVSRSLTPIALDVNTAGLDSGRQALTRFVKEAKDVASLKTFNTADDRREIEELTAAFGPLNAELRRLDPTGALQSFATNAEAAVFQLRQMAQAEADVAAGSAAVLAGGGGNNPPPPPTDQFSAFRNIVRELPGPIDAVTQAMGRATAGANAWAQGIARLEAQQAALAPSLAITQKIAKGFEDAGRQAAVASNATDPFQRGLRDIESRGLGAGNALDNLTATSGRTNRAFGEHVIGTGRLLNSFANLAAASLGVEGPLGKLAETVLFAAGGFGAVAAVAGAVVVLAKAHEFLTTAEREARKEREKLTTGLFEESKAADAAAAAQRGLAAALTTVAEARKKAEGIAGDIARATTNLPGFPVIARFAGEADRRNQKKLTEDQQAEAQADKNAQDVSARQLTQGIQLRVATSAEIARGTALLRSLQQQEQNTNLPLGERLKLHQQALDLLKAINHEEEAVARVAAIGTAAQDTNAQAQQRFTAEEAGARAHAAELKAITVQSVDEQVAANQTLFDRLRSIKQAAGRADVQALQTQLAATTQTPANTEAEKIALASTQDHLRAQITLRQEALGVAVAQLNQEQALADATARNLAGLLALQQQLRIAAAGGGNVLGGAPPVREERTIQTNTPEGQAQLPAIHRGVAQSGVTRDLEAGLDRDQKAAERFRQALSGVKDGALGIVSAFAGLTRTETLLDGTVQQVSLIGQAAQDAIGHVGGLVGSLGDLRAANAAQKVATQSNDSLGKLTAGLEKAASIASLIGQGISLIGGLFGKSAEQREHDEIVARNIRALEENTAAVRSAGTGASVANAAKATSVITDRIAATNAANLAAAQPTLGLGTPASVFTQPDIQGALKDAHLSLREWARIIKEQTGLDVLDKKGHIVAETLDVVNEAYRQTIEQITNFGTSITEQQQQADTAAKLGIPLAVGGATPNADPAVARLERVRDLELNNLKLSDAEEARIRALDLSTAKGRDAFLKEQQDLFRRGQAGGFTPEQLGGFASVQELLGPINDAADALGAFKESTIAATRELQNVPDVFKLGEAEFLARGPTLPTVPVPPGPGDGAQLPAFDPRQFPPGPHGVEFLPPLPSPALSAAAAQASAEPIVGELGRLGGGATLKQVLDALTTGATRSTTSPLNILGPLNVNVQGAQKDAATLAREILAELKRMASAGPGPTGIDGWP